MKLAKILAVAVLATVTVPVLAHHAAEGIVDEEIYAMIDEMVADTPHADMTLDDLGGGMTEMDITVMGLNSLDSLMDEDLIGLVAMLDGEVTLTIDFGDRRAITLTVLQIEPVGTDKSATLAMPATWGQLKAEFH